MLENGLKALTKQKDGREAYDMGIKDGEKLKEHPFFAEVDLSDMESIIEFKGNENAHPREEYNEWFVIRDSDLDFFKDFFKQIKERLKQYNRTKPDLKDLKFFAFVYNDFMINIQKITPKYVIEKRPLALLDFSGDEVQYKCCKSGVILENRIDAIIDLKENAIYFRKFEILSALDERFIELYREATKEEFNTFTDTIRKELNGGIEIEIDYEKIKPTNLKKINLILKKEEGNNQNNLDILLNSHKDQLKDYAKEFSPLYVNGNFKPIQENKDITNLLKILNEDYYLTYITQKKRESHSSVGIQ